MGLKIGFVIHSKNGYWCSKCEDWKNIEGCTIFNSYERAEQHLPQAFEHGGCRYLEIDKVFMYE